MFQGAKVEASRSAVLSVSAATFLCCLAGLSWHTYQISSPYFEYKVITTIEIDWPEDEDPKIMNICYDYFEEEFEDKFGHVDFTISQLWSGTPETNDMIASQKSDSKKKSCFGHRDSYDHAHCEHVDVIKYTYNEHSCYSFSLKNNSVKFNREYLINHHHDSTLLKVNVPMTEEANQTSGFLFLTEVNESPVQVLLRGVPATILSVKKNYRMRFDCLHIEKLASPYDDDCINYGAKIGHVDGYETNPRKSKKSIKKNTMLNDFITSFNCTTRGDCFMKCMDNFTTGTLGGAFPYSTHMAPINLTYYKIGDKETIDKYNNEFYKCSNLFKNVDCMMKTTLTKIEILSAYDLPESYSLSYALSESPTTEIISSPKIPFIDFLTFIFGSLGTWLGFSFMGFNPAKLMVIGKGGSNISNPNHLSGDQVTLFQMLISRIRKFEIAFSRLNLGVNKQLEKNNETTKQLIALTYQIKSDNQKLQRRLNSLEFVSYRRAMLNHR